MLLPSSRNGMHPPTALTSKNGSPNSDSLLSGLAPANWPTSNRRNDPIRNTTAPEQQQPCKLILDHYLQFSCSVSVPTDVRKDLRDESHETRFYHCAHASLCIRDNQCSEQRNTASGLSAPHSHFPFESGACASAGEKQGRQDSLFAYSGRFHPYG